MPRNRRLRPYANLLRALGLLAALGALGTAAVWRWAPGAIDACERRLAAWLSASIDRAFHDAKAESDPAARREHFEALLQRLQLADVQNEDRRAQIVRACYADLAGLAEAAGDQPRAIEWLRAASAFDARDLPTATRLGELMSQVPATATEGMELLRELAQRFPSNPIVVPALVRRLIARDQCRAALRELTHAAAQPQSNLWSITTENGLLGDLVPTRDDGELRLACDLAQPIATTSGPLRVLAPRHRDLRGVEARYALSAGDQRIERTAIANTRLAEDRTAFEIDLDGLNRVDGTLGLVFEVADAPYTSTTLAAPALDERMARLAGTLQAGTLQEAEAELAALRHWRLAALRGACTLSHRAGKGEYRVTRRFLFELAESNRFRITAHFDEPVTEVVVLLPLLSGYRLQSVDWIRTDGSESSAPIRGTERLVLAAPHAAAQSVRITGSLF